MQALVGAAAPVTAKDVEQAAMLRHAMAPPL